MKCTALLLCLGLVVPVVGVAQDGGQADGSGVDSAVAKVDSLQQQLEKLQAESAQRADDPGFYFELGNIYADLLRREEAIAAYQAAIDLDGEFVEAVVNLGALKNEIGRTDEAIQLLKRAIELRPDDARAHVNLGNAYYSQGQYYDAMTQFRQALEIDPSSHEAHYQIAVAFADAGIYREAIRQWQKVIEIAPGTDASDAAQENIRIVEKILAQRL